MPTDCMWDDQQKCYICDIIGTPSDIVIRTLRVSRFIKDISKLDHLYITAPPEMNDTEILWNKKYITLFVSIYMSDLTCIYACDYPCSFKEIFNQ